MSLHFVEMTEDQTFFEKNSKFGQNMILSFSRPIPTPEWGEPPPMNNIELPFELTHNNVCICYGQVLEFFPPAWVM